MFLIRDWNTPAVFKYGISGGEKFLERKLQLKADQSPTAQTVRRLIKKCFKEVSCFLMPDPGDKAKEDIDFNGSVAHLSDRFVTKMKEFINHFLNPEELKPKMINNKYITGSDLYEYLKAYVEIFNSDELPKPVDIVEATAKTADLIYINKLKVNAIRICFIFIH
jgi:atlastin